MNLRARNAVKGVLFHLLFAIWLCPSAIHALVSDQISAMPMTEGHDGPAELPRTHVQSTLHDTPALGKVILVHAGEDPSRALAQASCGDTIELQAGATFGRLLLPEKNCDDSHWIIVRTSAPDSKLPPEGTRLTPCYAGVLSLPGRPPFKCTSAQNVLTKIEFDGKGGSGPVTVASGANHYRLIGLEVTRTVSPAAVYNLISEKGAADHLIFDRMWVHGTPQNETVRGILLSHIRYAAVVDSYFSDFHCVAKTGACTDSQAVAGGLGDDPMGPFKIANNFLEAAGECILMGGGAATTTPADIEIKRNHFFKPMLWMKGQPGFVGGVDGGPFIVKNLFELKNAQRVLFEGNILENTWGGFSQYGFAILLGPKNQAAGATQNVCPICQVTDITIRYVTISHVAGGLQIGNGLSDNGGAAKDGGRYSIHDIIVDDIQPDVFNGFGVFAQISMTPGISASPRLHDLSIDHATAFPPRTLFIFGGPRADPRMSGVSITNSLFTAGNGRAISIGGGPEKNCAAMPASRSVENILHDCFSSYAFHHNVIVEGGQGWPKENKTLKTMAEVALLDYKHGNGGDYHLQPSSPYKGVGTDGKDLGADVDALKSAIAGVE